jgi:preprotein translocase subunit SecD
MNAWHWRAVFYATFLIGCVMTIWPPYARNGEPGRIKLGLDLRGGTYLVLQVEGEGTPPASGKAAVAPEIMRDVIRALERRVNQLGVADAVVTEYGRLVTGPR